MASAASLRRTLCLALIVTAPLAGCKTLEQPWALASTTDPQKIAALPADEATLRRQAEGLGRRYDSNAEDRDVVLAYAATLRRLQQSAQAVSVLQREAARNPDDLEVLGAYGKALADAGRFSEAADVLSRAHTPERPNWSILSAQGFVADQLGEHRQAQAYYEAALKIDPTQATVLSNLGLSYALSKDLEQAENISRRAAEMAGADERVRQNLTFVLELRGMKQQASATPPAAPRVIVSKTPATPAVRTATKPQNPSTKAAALDLRQGI